MSGNNDSAHTRPTSDPRDVRAAEASLKLMKAVGMYVCNNHGIFGVKKFFEDPDSADAIREYESTRVIPHTKDFVLAVWMMASYILPKLEPGTMERILGVENLHLSPLFLTHTTIKWDDDETMRPCEDVDSTETREEGNRNMVADHIVENVWKFLKKGTDFVKSKRLIGSGRVAKYYKQHRIWDNASFDVFVLGAWHTADVLRGSAELGKRKRVDDE